MFGLSLCVECTNRAIIVGFANTALARVICWKLAFRDMVRVIAVGLGVRRIAVRCNRSNSEKFREDKIPRNSERTKFREDTDKIPRGHSTPNGNHSTPNGNQLFRLSGGGSGRRRMSGIDSYELSSIPTREHLSLDERLKRNAPVSR